MIPPGARRRPALLLLATAFGLGCIFSARRAATDAADSAPRWIALRERAPSDGGVADAPAPVTPSAPSVIDRATLPRCPDGSVYIPGGRFAMGSPAGEGAPDEHPQHTVLLHGYCLDRTEVTVDAYTRCVRAGACTRPVATLPEGAQPVSGVDWHQSEGFCRFVGGRLPTEAEWEFAARGTDGRRYPWGNDDPSGCERLDWTFGNESCGGVGPSTVGTHPGGASPFGVLDLSGNVWEWTADWYARQYEAAMQENPTGPAEGSARVTRGGGFNNDQVERQRATFREGQHPNFHDYDLGVRCAYDPSS